MHDSDRVLMAYRNVFSSPDAGIVLKDLGLAAHFFEPSFVNANPEGTAYNEGARYLYLRILRFSGFEEHLLEQLEKTNGRRTNGRRTDTHESTGGQSAGKQSTGEQPPRRDSAWKRLAWLARFATRRPERP